jgi:ATP-dependent DNA helicase PIF1
LSTGAAGTGKTTMVQRFIAEHPKCLVLAPTGVAAINTGGETAHSVFRFPLSVRDLLRALPKPKDPSLLANLETLLIDEVSMVTPLLLDKIEQSLRYYGPCPGEPFGGVRVALICDA